MSIVCVNYDDQKRIGLNVPILKQAQNLLKEILMPRFYFTLASKDAHITDDVGKEFDTLNDAYEHALKLIHKILFHVGYDDAEAWKAVILNDQHAAQIIVPFSVSDAFRAQRQKTG